MTAQQLRNSILQQAIQGRLVPQDPSEGSADVLLSAIRQKKELLYKSKKINFYTKSKILWLNEKKE